MSKPVSLALLVALAAALPSLAMAGSPDRDFNGFSPVIGGVVPLKTQAPSLPAPVAERAAEAVACARASGQRVDRLIVVDMAKKATQERLWAFDLTARAQSQLLLHTKVAHGAGSDPDKDGVAERFSNRPGSGMTSLGLFRIAEAYMGKHGLSRRLDGLMEGFNDAARDRAVVLP